jgi:hypothetical protein
MAGKPPSSKLRRLSAARPMTRGRRSGVEPGDGIPASLHDAIEAERDNLAKAESVLGCLAVSMEYETDPVTGPYYPDVAQIAREMVRQSINRLDSVVLQKILLRNRIKEEPGRCMYLQGSIPSSFVGLGRLNS